MTTLTTANLAGFLPESYAGLIIDQAKTSSTVAKLSAQEPMRFGKVNFVKFNDGVKAEFVEESGQKASTTGEWEKVTAVPHKAQVTVRVSNEFLWADEDYQLGVIERDLVPAARKALDRALDLGLYHAVNPLTGAKIGSWTNYLTATELAVTHDSADADADIRAAAGLVIGANKDVNGIALDPKQAWALGDLQAGATGQPRYPQIGLGTEINNFLGVNAAVSNTVSGRPEAADTGIRAIVGDFQNGIRWGIQRDLPLEVIPYGDPDGGGDLKRKNEVALRLELVYAWHVLADRFAVVKETLTRGE